MEEVNESIKFINEKFEEMEADRKEKERPMLELKNEVKTLNENIETMCSGLDHHEQYSGRNCFPILGVKENERSLKKKCKKKYQPMT